MAGAATKADDTIKIIKILCHGDKVFELTHEEACVSEIWQTALATGVAQLPNPDITDETMQTVIKFCKQYASDSAAAAAAAAATAAAADDDDMSDGTFRLIIKKPLKSREMSENLPEGQWSYVSFVNDMDKDTLFVLLEVATKLKIEQLRELTCAKLASMIKGKTPDEIRAEFNIVNNYTPEEEKKIEAENAWMREI